MALRRAGACGRCPNALRRWIPTRGVNGWPRSSNLNRFLTSNPSQVLRACWSASMKTALAPRAGLSGGNSERANDRFCSVRPVAGSGGDCRTQRSRQDDVLPLASGRCRVAVRQRRPPGAELAVKPYEAARLADALRRAMLDQGESFIFETVFSDPVGEKIGFLEEATRRGYTVVLCYIGLADPQQSVERVAMRVLQGGHDVPVKKLRERYARSLNNLEAAIARLPYVLVYDNSDLNMAYRQVAIFADRDSAIGRSRSRHGLGR